MSRLASAASRSLEEYLATARCEPSRRRMDVVHPSPSRSLQRDPPEVQEVRSRAFSHDEIAFALEELECLLKRLGS